MKPTERMLRVCRAKSSFKKSSKQQVAASKNQRYSIKKHFGLFSTVSFTVWFHICSLIPTNMNDINMYILHRPHGVCFVIFDFYLSTVTIAHWKMLSSLWCLGHDSDLIPSSDISMAQQSIFMCLIGISNLNENSRRSLQHVCSSCNTHWAPEYSINENHLFIYYVIILE